MKFITFLHNNAYKVCPDNSSYIFEKKYFQFNLTNMHQDGSNEYKHHALLFDNYEKKKQNKFRLRLFQVGIGLMKCLSIQGRKNKHDGSCSHETKPGLLSHFFFLLNLPFSTHSFTFFSCNYRIGNMYVSSYRINAAFLNIQFKLVRYMSQIFISFCRFGLSQILTLKVVNELGLQCVFLILKNRCNIKLINYMHTFKSISITHHIFYMAVSFQVYLPQNI